MWSVGSERHYDSGRLCCKFTGYSDINDQFQREEDESGAGGKPGRDSSEDADKNDDTHSNTDDDYHYGTICTGNSVLNKHHLEGIFTVHLAGEVNMDKLPKTNQQ